MEFSNKKHIEIISTWIIIKNIIIFDNYFTFAFFFLFTL
jgi:hypothetical protein